MKKNTLYIILALSIITSYAFAGSVALSEVPRPAVMFAEKYFPDSYLYRATEMGGSYTLIFKGGLKIYVNGKGEWQSINGGGDEISIEYLDDKIKNAARNIVKTEFANKKIIAVQKKSKEYRFQLMNGKKFSVDFEGNVTKK